MNLIAVQETGTKLYMPSTLEECDERQYAAMALLIYRYDKKEIDYYTLRIHAVYALFNMEVSENDNGELQEQKNSNIFQLSELVDSFFEEVEGKKMLVQHYTKNHTPYVVPIRSKLYGPTNEFENVKYGEYMEALNFFSEYHQTGERQYLFMLMATLYRKAKNNDDDGDIRIPYNPYKVQKIAKRLELIDFGKVYGFYLYFASFQKYLATSKIYWMGNELDLSILFEDEKEIVDSGIPGLGLKSTLYSLAESGVYGTVKELKKQPLWEVLMRMYDVVKKDKDASARMKAAESKSKT